MSQDIDEMMAEKRARETEHQLTTMELLMSADLRKALIIGIGLMIAQQLSGMVWSGLFFRRNCKY